VDLSPGDVTHLFLSHRHGDHCLGFPMFALWWKLCGEGRPLPTLLGARLTLDTVRLLWENVYGDLPQEWFPEIELSSAPGAVVDLKEHELNLTTWPMDHSTSAPVLGLRLEVAGLVLAFTADTRICPWVVELARGADLLVHDANFAATVEPAMPD